jgi:hypothetical protein
MTAPQIAKRIARVDPGLGLEVKVVSRSPHVVAYKIWVKRPGSDWVSVGEGQTADQLPDSHSLDPLPKDTVLDYWLGIGGNAMTAWSALLTLEQNGRPVEGGECSENGTTDVVGVDMRETEVTLI